MSIASRPGRHLQSSHPFLSELEYDDTPVTRIGVVVPFDFGLDWEYWRYLPDDVELHFTRTPYLNKPVGIPLARAVAKPSVVARATRSLAVLDPAVTVYACSSGSFVNGLAGEELVRRTMLAAGARIAITSAGAMLGALRLIGARRVAIASPYDRRLSDRLANFLTEAGFEVPSTTFLGLTDHIAQVSRRSIAELIRTSAHPDADAVFVSCTSLRTQGMIAELEAEIGCPIMTSNQVTLWAALAAADALPTDPESEVKGWVLGGGDPMAESTEMLLEHGTEGSAALEGVDADSTSVVTESGGAEQPAEL